MKFFLIQIIALILSMNVLGNDKLVVIKKEYRGKLKLNLIRAELGSFDTLEFINENSRRVDIVCANNRAYDNNKKAFLIYRNFYDRVMDKFEIPSNTACEELKKFIFFTEGAVDEKRPFKLVLNIGSKTVSEIEYPDIDPYAVWGDHDDLFEKSKILLIKKYKNEKRVEKKVKKIKLH